MLCLYFLKDNTYNNIFYTYNAYLIIIKNGRSKSVAKF